MERIGDLIQYLCRCEIDEIHIEWPPDAFAICGTILERSGAYLSVVSIWPPRSGEDAPWSQTIAEIGQAWRNLACKRKRTLPERIGEAWQTIVSSSDVPVQALRDETEELAQLRVALMTIFAAADEACAGVGIPGEGESRGPKDGFSRKLLRQLVKQQTDEAPATLCLRICPSKAVVLPKLHTPQHGITLRSMSHHLALSLTPEVSVGWMWVEDPRFQSSRHGLNVLVLPWPLEISPSDFSPCKKQTGALEEMDPERFGFFEYTVRGGRPLDSRLLRRVVKKAISTVGSVDMIVMPELSLMYSDIDPLGGVLEKLDPIPIFVGGFCFKGRGFNGPGGSCGNASMTVIPLADGSFIGQLQHKHHRWLLDGPQIRQYGLGSVLDPTVHWWEHTKLPQRRMQFISLQSWLTMCTLICEDLARPDPIGNIVRAVGPNLVIALLMDGPQLAGRWSARYCSVLADDPGSSVLTVSPLGMVKLCRPPGSEASSVVALWKDALSGPVEVQLPDGYQGIVLSLNREWKTEFTADGRSDGGATAYLRLSGMHPISVDKP